MKGEAGVAEGKPSLFVSHADSFGNITADGFAFSLCKGTQASQDHFAVHIRGIDVFFLKYNGDTPAFEDSDVLDAVEGIPCKSGNGFCQDEVYFLFPAELYHFIELIPLFGPHPGDPIVCKNSGKLPAIVMGDLFGVIVHLYLKAVLLFFFLGAYPAVGRNSQLSFSLSQISQHGVCRDFHDYLLWHGKFAPFKLFFHSAAETLWNHPAAGSPASRSARKVPGSVPRRCYAPEKEPLF